MQIFDPDVGKAKSAGIHSVTGTYEIAVYNREILADEDIKRAMVEQEEIGWYHFLLGRISIKWREIGPDRDTRERGHLEIRNTEVRDNDHHLI